MRLNDDLKKFETRKIVKRPVAGRRKTFFPVTAASDRENRKLHLTNELVCYVHVSFYLYILYFLFYTS